MLLTTFKVGGTGLDFVAATRVFILDPILADNALLAQAKCEYPTETRGDGCRDPADAW